eukprot:1147568-Pelagomonas_calceolata.AAC.2
MPSSYLLSTTKVCALGAAADHKHKPVEQPLDPQWCRHIKCTPCPAPRPQAPPSTRLISFMPLLAWPSPLLPTPLQQHPMHAPHPGPAAFRQFR